MTINIKRKRNEMQEMNKKPQRKQVNGPLGSTRTHVSTVSFMLVGPTQYGWLDKVRPHVGGKS